MKKFLVSVLLGAGVLSVAAKAPKDPVLLTVDGNDVTLSEFEYFYHKNDGNALESETPEQYLERFIVYKLKVAQARHERQDTMAEVRKDFKQHRREIARPYLSDTTVYNDLLQQSLSHLLEDVNTDFIVMPIADKAKADSIRKEIAAGHATFGEMAAKYSLDTRSRANGGNLGWFSAQNASGTPYEIEEAIYETPLGEVSDVVVNGTYAYLFHPTERRPNLGEIHGAHILVSFEKHDSVEAKNKIDSIYTALQQHRGTFESLAKLHSDCPSSEQGGDLRWFGRGQMVQDFENVIFALGVNEYSEPFTTRFGWHIAMKLDERKPDVVKSEKMVRELMTRDVRNNRPRTARAEQLKKEYNTHIDNKGHDYMFSVINSVGYDSAKVVLKDCKTPLFFVADSIITIGDFLASNYRLAANQPQDTQLEDRLNDRLLAATLTYENNRLEQKYPSFRLQSNEYQEGLMLIASMEQNVWNRATDDPEGLNEYFQSHKSDYAYESPRWKGYVFYSTSDSIIKEVERYLYTFSPNPDELGDSIKAHFPKGVKIERVVLPEGNNEVVDYVAFNGPEPKFPGTMWRHFTTYRGHLIDGPEEVADVRGRVTSDWLKELEQNFVEELRQRYKVKVNKKVLKQAK